MNDTNPILKKVRCGKVSLQQLRRIALPPILIENMGIAEGDELMLYFDPDNKAAVLVKAEIAKQPTAKYAKKGRTR